MADLWDAVNWRLGKGALGMNAMVVIRLLQVKRHYWWHPIRRLQLAIAIRQEMNEFDRLEELIDTKEKKE